MSRIVMSGAVLVNAIIIFGLMGSCSGGVSLSPAFFGLGVILNLLAFGLASIEKEVKFQRNQQVAFLRSAEEQEWEEAIENASWFEEMRSIIEVGEFCLAIDKDEVRVRGEDGIELERSLYLAFHGRDVTATLPRLPKKVVEAYSNLRRLRGMAQYVAWHGSSSEFHQILSQVGPARVRYERARGRWMEVEGR